MRHRGVSDSEFSEFYVGHRDRCLRAVVASGLRPDEAEEAVTDRVAMFWLPGDVTLSRAEYEAATVTAYDEDGDVLDTISIHRQLESPPVS
ncbi:MAG: hypothetical protein WC558_16895 [Patulibacter sp.]